MVQNSVFKLRVFALACFFKMYGGLFANLCVLFVKDIANQVQDYIFSSVVNIFKYIDLNPAILHTPNIKFAHTIYNILCNAQRFLTSTSYIGQTHKHLSSSLDNNGAWLLWVTYFNANIDQQIKLFWFCAILCVRKHFRPHFTIVKA